MKTAISPIPKLKLYCRNKYRQQGPKTAGGSRQPPVILNPEHVGNFFIIHKVAVMPEARYCCEYNIVLKRNIISVIHLTVPFFISDQTLIKVPPKNITVPEGKVFDLRCEADFDNRLEIRYYWQKDGFTLTNIQDSSRRVYWDESKNVLRVKAVEIDDAGEYTCVAFTPGPAESEARASAVVNIKGRFISVFIPVTHVLKNFPNQKYFSARFAILTKLNLEPLEVLTCSQRSRALTAQ